MNEYKNPENIQELFSYNEKFTFSILYLNVFYVWIWTLCVNSWRSPLSQLQGGQV